MLTAPPRREAPQTHAKNAGVPRSKLQGQTHPRLLHPGAHHPLPRRTPIPRPALRCRESKGNALISIILPAKNEAAALAVLLPKLRAAQPDAEIIVSDDGSTDETASLCSEHRVTRIGTP